ncbi:Serine/threonine-protein kinase PLK4 [Favolaschia claudopus]|uniref:Serine/threonine-protein kinase PLK4 n=1 Tax=Favolaschia claudopus TaxID=2862362 RepID=A0AAW0AAE6_9AGAR
MDPHNLCERFVRIPPQTVKRYASRNESFLTEIRRIREESDKLRSASNVLDQSADAFFESSSFHAIYHISSRELYLAIYDVPGALSGNILRLRANIPWEKISTHSEIRGDDISAIPFRSFGDLDYPDEDTTDLVAQLPLVAFDEEIHFTKVSRLRSEIPNLLKAKGLPHVVQLLGRTGDGQLVFPKLLPITSIWFAPRGIALFKRILLQLAQALIALHLIGIIHRDIHIANILISSDHQPDRLLCPEISDAYASRANIPTAQAPYSEKSDVFMFGSFMAEMILQNTVRMPWQVGEDGDWVPPAPFRSIVLACVAREPSARPTMIQVKAMLEAICEPAE